MKVNIKNINLKISDNFYKKRKEIFRFSKSVFLKSIPRNNDYILDIGCGSGLNSNKLSKLGYSPIGIDLSFVGLNSYKKKYSCICQDLDYGLCIKNSSFNYVFMSEVIEHLNYTDIVLGEIKRILKKNGFLYLSTPNSNFWVYRIYALLGKNLSEVQHPGHIHFFSKNTLEKKLLSHNLIIKKEFSNFLIMILPDFKYSFYRRVLEFFGFKREMRFKTKKYFWHLSFASNLISNFWSETIMLHVQKKS